MFLPAVQMEAMEVDSPVEMQGGGSRQQVDAPHVISDLSGSSTEDDDDSAGGRTAARAPPRLPATWAFSQRAVGGSAATPSAARGAPLRRRLRYEGLV